MKQKPAVATVVPPEVRPGQSLELLKALHILTRDGKLNQDSRRKLKQVYHLFQFIEKLLLELPADQVITLADHGAGKSYLGFIIYDLFFKALGRGHIYGIETRAELVQNATALAAQLGFERMHFLNLSVADATLNTELPARFDMVTAQRKVVARIWVAGVFNAHHRLAVQQHIGQQVAGHLRAGCDQNFITPRHDAARGQQPVLYLVQQRL